MTFIALVALSLAVTVAVALVERRAQRAQTQTLNQGVVSLVSRGIVDRVDEVRGDALTLGHTLLAEQVLSNPGAPGRARAEKLFIALAQARMDYSQLRLIDNRGHEIARVDTAGGISRAIPTEQLQDKQDRPYVQAIATLGRGRVYVSRLDLNIEQGQIVRPLEPTVRVGAPVFSDNGQRVGMVVINLDGRDLLARVRDDASLGRGEVWLTDGEGRWLIGPDPSQEWRLGIPGQSPAGLSADFPELWSVVSHRPSGQASGRYGLASFRQVALAGATSGNDVSDLSLRVIARAALPSVADILLDRTHLLFYLLSVPILLLVAGWLRHLGSRLVGARGEVAANSRLLRDIFEHSSLAMKVKNLDGQIVRANASAGVLLGRPPAELLGASIDVVATAATVALVRAHDHEVIRQREVTTYEEQVEYLSGSHTLLTTRFPVTNEDGQVEGVGAISVDITPHVQMEQWLRLAKDQAEAANVAKATFLANMSHELRTPLNSIIGLGELLHDQAEESRADSLSVDSLRRVVGAGRHLLALINDILDISRIEAGYVELAPELLCVSALTSNVLDSLRLLAKTNGNQLTLEIAEDPGPIWIDAVRMRQILTNLVGNAIKFTRNGNVNVRLGVLDHRLMVSITDTGIGMSPEQLTRIFTPFEQADRSISRRYGGTGLGLAISRQLIELMGGQIDVASASGEGSVFTVLLPLSAAEVGATEPSLRPAAHSDTARQPIVLVVDDDESARRVVCATLERQGLSVMTAGSGAEALAMVRSERPAVMLLDILLGDMSGWDVLTVLRADPEHADLPVILCTVTDRDHRTASLSVIEHLTKPVDRDRLASLVRRFVTSHLPASVLVVDDDADYRVLVASLLQREGHVVHLAAGGEIALKQMRRQPPDLVLLDLIMPGMDGLAVIAAMRVDPVLAAIKVVLVTAADVPDDMLHQINERAVLLVRKGDADLKQVASRVLELVQSTLPDSADSST